MRTKLTTLFALLALLTTSSCHEIFDLLDELNPGETKVSEYASGLSAPWGLVVDRKGNVWVAEAGTGNNDGRVSVITSAGNVYPVIEGLPPYFRLTSPRPWGSITWP